MALKPFIESLCNSRLPDLERCEAWKYIAKISEKQLNKEFLSARTIDKRKLPFISAQHSTESISCGG
jgi:hypothetical protein